MPRASFEDTIQPWVSKTFGVFLLQNVKTFADALELLLLVPTPIGKSILYFYLFASFALDFSCNLSITCWIEVLKLIRSIGMQIRVSFTWLAWLSILDLLLGVFVIYQLHIDIVYLSITSPAYIIILYSVPGYQSTLISVNFAIHLTTFQQVYLLCITILKVWLVICIDALDFF